MEASPFLPALRTGPVNIRVAKPPQQSNLAAQTRAPRPPAKASNNLLAPPAPQRRISGAVRRGSSKGAGKRKSRASEANDAQWAMQRQADAQRRQLREELFATEEQLRTMLAKEESELRKQLLAEARGAHGALLEEIARRKYNEMVAKHEFERNELVSHEFHFRTLIDREELYIVEQIEAARRKEHDIAFDRARGRAGLEEEERAELAKLEITWRREDIEEESAAWKQLMALFRQEWVVLFDEANQRRCAVDRVEALEMRERVKVIQTEVEAHFALLNEFRLESDLAESRAHKRRFQEWERRVEQQFRRGTNECITAETLERAVILDEHAYGMKKLRDTHEQSSLDAQRRCTERETGEISAQRKVILQEQRERADMTGFEEQERLRLEYVERRGQSRALAVTALRHNCEALAVQETAARAVVLQEESAFRQEVADAEEVAETVILQAANRTMFEEARRRRYERKSNDLCTAERDARRAAQDTELRERRDIALGRAQGRVAIKQQVAARDVAECEQAHWLDIRREYMEACVALSDREKLLRSLQEVFVSEGAGRRALEDDEEEAASTLLMQHCRVIVEENRRALQRRKQRLQQESLERSQDSLTASASQASSLPVAERSRQLRATVQSLRSTDDTD